MQEQEVAGVQQRQLEHEQGAVVQPAPRRRIAQSDEVAASTSAKTSAVMPTRLASPKPGSKRTSRPSCGTTS